MYLLLSPKVDFAFKKIFGSEKNKSVLISFFNAVFEGVNEKIKSFEFKNADIQKECLIDNFSRIDVKAMTDKNQIVDIEIQILTVAYHGTGDIFASTCVGGLMNGLGLPEALTLAADYTRETIAVTTHTPQSNWYGVEFEQAIPMLLRRLGKV